MDTNVIYWICNLLPLLLILFYIIDGWTKGALYMLVSIIRLFGSYLIARFLGTVIVSNLMTLPVIRSHIASIAAGQQNIITQMAGAIYLFTGGSLQSSLEMIAYWILYALTFIVIFIILNIVFSILQNMSKKLNDVPMLGSFNRLVGAVEGFVFGTASALILVYIVAIVLKLSGEEQLSLILLSSWVPATFRAILNTLF